MVAALREEIARLKGGPGRPNIRPSRIEQGSEPMPSRSSGERKRPRSSTRSKLTVDEERTAITNVQNGAVGKVESITADLLDGIDTLTSFPLSSFSSSS